MREVKKGATNITVYFHLRDSSDGTSKTGLLYNSAGAVASYVRNGAARTAITLATLASASAAHADGGFILVDDTNAKGLYRLDIPDAAFATSVDGVVIHIGFTGVFEESLEIVLVDNIAKDVYDIVNHASYGNAKLVRSTTPANPLDVDASGDVTAENMRGTDGAATASALSTHDGKLDTVGANVDLILSDTDELQTNQGNWLTATGFATAAALATAQADLDTITETDGVTLATAQGNYAPLKSGVVMTESYAADGSTATPEQILYMIWSAVSEFAISGTTLTCKKLDGSAPAMTFTLDDGTDPTSRTRAT
jgi:hypothetical protein